MARACGPSSTPNAADTSPSTPAGRLDPVGRREDGADERRRGAAPSRCASAAAAVQLVRARARSYPPTAVAQVGLRWSRRQLAERIEERASTNDGGRPARRGRPLGRAADVSHRRQALGYKELLEHLEGRGTLDEAVGTIIRRTRQFAVRQERWFRRDPRIRWVDVDGDPLAVLPALLAEETACA